MPAAYGSSKQSRGVSYSARKYSCASTRDPYSDDHSDVFSKESHHHALTGWRCRFSSEKAAQPGGFFIFSFSARPAEALCALHALWNSSSGRASVSSLNVAGSSPASKTLEPCSLGRAEFFLFSRPTVQPYTQTSAGSNPVGPLTRTVAERSKAHVSHTCESIVAGQLGRENLFSPRSRGTIFSRAQPFSPTRKAIRGFESRRLPKREL